MISSDVRHAIGRAVAAAGLEPADPRLRPTGTPGQYASGVAFAFGEPAGQTAARIAALLAGEHIGRTEVTGPGFITVTVPPAVLAALPDRIIAAGPACASSDALLGLTVPAPPLADPLTAPGWEEARAALAAQLTARLAAAAGARVARPGQEERAVDFVVPPRPPVPAGGARGGTVRSGAREAGSLVTGQRQETDVTAAVAFAGADAVLFALARAVPGRPAFIDPLAVARQVTGNPAYAVRYAHARAAAELRWAAGHREPAALRGQPGPRHSSAGQGDLLMDALSWLPERVAAAGRRGRPDEFARYLEELARATIAALIRAGHPGRAQAPGTDRLGLAGAARTGLAAGLGLLGISAPDRL